MMRSRPVRPVRRSLARVVKERMIPNIGRISSYRSLASDVGCRRRPERVNRVIPSCVSSCLRLAETAGCEIFKCSAVSTVVEHRIIAAKISSNRRETSEKLSFSFTCAYPFTMPSAMAAAATTGSTTASPVSASSRARIGAMPAHPSTTAPAPRSPSCTANSRTCM